MPPFSPPLHFLLVGVPKAGTSSLHRALDQHPELTLPYGKEAPFFCTSHPTPDRWHRFAREVFPRPWKRLGKITPQYWYCPDLPDLLSRAFPSLRILILLRHPVARFYSEYAMYYRRGAVRDPLTVFVRRALHPQRIQTARRSPLQEGQDPAAHFLVCGEYASGIRRYQRHFSHVGVFFFEDLIARPAPTLQAILRFLDVSPFPLTFPREHTGEVGFSRFLARILKQLRAVPAFRALGKRLLGPRRHTWNWFIETRDVVHPHPPPLDPESAALLRDYYRPHVQELAHLIGHPPPWPDLLA